MNNRTEKKTAEESFDELHDALVELKKVYVEEINRLVEMLRSIFGGHE